jgi:hypothetical protein
MMGDNLDTRRAIAIHEAGHAIAHLHYRDRVRSLSIGMDGGGRTRAASRADRPPVQAAICCLAGAAAEAKLIGRGYAAACTVDIEHAKRHLAGTGLAVSDVWPEALRLINRYRAPIELVARALLRSGSLDADQFIRLVHPKLERLA